MPGRPLAVLDTNILFPFELRGILLFLASYGLFDPLWSADILEELRRNIIRREIMAEEALERLLDQMRRFFPDSLGIGYEDRVPYLSLPDAGDRHVLALAIEYEAEYIVTRNLRDFPSVVVKPLGPVPIDPTDFVEVITADVLDIAMRAANEHRLSHTKAPLAPEQYLHSLRTRAGLGAFADKLASKGFLSF